MTFWALTLSLRRNCLCKYNGRQDFPRLYSPLLSFSSLLLSRLVGAEPCDWHPCPSHHPPWRASENPQAYRWGRGCHGQVMAWPPFPAPLSTELQISPALPHTVSLFLHSWICPNLGALKWKQANLRAPCCLLRPEPQQVWRSGRRQGIQGPFTGLCLQLTPID